MPFPFPVRKQLLDFPRTSATWLAGSTPLADEHVCLILQGDGTPRVTAVLATAPDAEDWQRLWLYALKGERGQKAMRPGTVRVLDAAVAAHLRPVLEPLKMKVETCEALPVLQTALAQQRGEAPMTAGSTWAMLERPLYLAAAEFAKLRPWRYFWSEPEFAINLPHLGWQQPVAVMMGGNGQTFGLAIFKDADALLQARSTIGRGMHGEQVAVTLESRRDTPSSVRQHAEMRRLPVEPGMFPRFGHRSTEDRLQETRSVLHARVLADSLQVVTAWMRVHLFHRLTDSDLPLDEVVRVGDAACVLRNPESWGQNFDDDEEDHFDDDEAANALDEVRMHAATTTDPDVVAAARRESAVQELEEVAILRLHTTSKGILDLDWVLEEATELRFVADPEAGAVLRCVQDDEDLVLAECARRPADAERWQSVVTQAQDLVLVQWLEAPDDDLDAAHVGVEPLGQRLVRLHQSEVLLELPH